MESRKQLSLVGRVFGQIIEAVPVHGILVIAGAITEGIFPAVSAGILAKLLDTMIKFVTGEEKAEKIAVYGIWFVACYIIKQIFQLISAVSVNAGLFEKSTYFIRKQLAEKTSKLPLRELENEKIINLQQRAKSCVDNEEVPMVYYNLIHGISYLLSMISVGIMMLQYHYLFLFLVIISIVPYFVQKLREGKKVYELQKSHSWKNSECLYLWSLFFDASSVKEIRTLNATENIRKEWYQKKKELLIEEQDYQKISEKESLIAGLIWEIGYIAAFVFTLVLLFSSTVTIGQFSAVISVFASLQSAVGSFFGIVGRLPGALSYIADYYEYIDLKEDKNTGVDNLDTISEIVLEQVTFQYPNTEKETLRNINLKIKKGEKIAIVGENGSGKTTLVKLLLSLYEPTSGSILINGKRIESYGKEDVYDKMSFLPQNFTHFKLSLGENIEFREKIESEGRMISALKKANCDAVYDKSNGIEGVLGREFGGIELSGGEWQNLAMARVLYHDKEIAVLDEPSSAMDALKENEILSTYLHSLGNKTAIFTSHRIGLCRLVDRILVVKDGCIVENGSHDELIALRGEYARLYETQKMWYS